MSFTRTRLPGFWTFGSTIAPAEFEHIDDYAYAVDGLNGGTYNPSALLTIGGSGLTVAGPFNTNTAGTIQVGTSFTIKLGATMQLVGNTVVNSAAIVGFASGSFLTVSSGGTLTGNAGSIVTLAGTNTLSGTTTVTGALSLNNTTTIIGSNVINYDAPRVFAGKCFGAFDVDRTIWQPEAAAPFSWPARAEQIANSTTPPTGHLIYEADMPTDATILTVTQWVEPGSGHAAVPGNPPVMFVYLYDSSAGTTTLLGSDTIAAGSVVLYEVRTQLSITCPPATVVTAGKRVLVYLRGEGGSDYEPGLLVDTPQTTYSVAALPLG